MAFGTVAAAGVSGSGSRAAVSPAATRDSPCPSAHEHRAVGPADLEADVGRIVEVAHVFRDRERPHRRGDVTAQADRDLIFGLEQPFQIGVLVVQGGPAQESAGLARAGLRPHFLPVKFPPPVVLLLALLHVYIGVRLLLPFDALTQLVGASLLALCFWLLPKGFRIRDDRGPWAVMLPWLTMGFFSWLLVLTLARDVSLIVSALALSQEAHESWIRISAIGVMALTTAITLVGFFMARRVAPVVDVEVPLAGLAKELEGFTIAQISDIHVGQTIKRNFVEAIVDRVNLLQADMIAITGDVVDGSVPDLAHHTEPLARL